MHDSPVSNTALWFSNFLTWFCYYFASRRNSRDNVTQLGSSKVVTRAKIKSVKVMGILVSGFIICWTPYYVMSLWWWIDQAEI